MEEIQITTCYVYMYIYIWYPVSHGIFSLPTGAGCLPSKEVHPQKFHRDHFKRQIIINKQGLPIIIFHEGYVTISRVYVFVPTLAWWIKQVYPYFCWEGSCDLKGMKLEGLNILNTCEIQNYNKGSFNYSTHLWGIKQYKWMVVLRNFPW